MRPLLHALLFWLSASLCAPGRPFAQGIGPGSSLAAEVRRAGDDADPESIRQLAASASPEALQVLEEALDRLQDRYLKGVILECLPAFAGHATLEEAALERLVRVATNDEVPEFREAALDALARCAAPGRARLAAIVISEADRTVRERALQRHVEGAMPEDAAWYASIWHSRPAKGHARNAEPVFDDVLRESAFAGVVGTLEEGELVEATEDALAGVRRRAFAALAVRGDSKALKCAQRLYDDRAERPETRVAAAAFLLRERGARQADELFRDATQLATTPEVAFGLADLLAQVQDARLRRSILKNLGDGRGQEVRVTLRMAAGIDDPKVDEALTELSNDPDPSVVVDVLRTMVERGNAAHLVRARELLEPPNPATVRAAALEAVVVLAGATEAIWSELRPLARDPEEAVRNAALELLGDSGDPAQVDVLIQALGHALWSTRLAATRAIESLRVPAGVGALCARIAREEGRTAFEMRAALWRLTGQPLGMGTQWTRWWEAEGASFRFPTPEELERRRAEQARREARQTSRSFRGVQIDSRFFGLRVFSHSVAFVVDVSGSMQERLPGATGAKAPTRMEIARRELMACMESLERGTRFNILPFSNHVAPWKEKAVVLDEDTFPEAAAFVEQLRPLEATNLFEGLWRAFDDEQVDTIFLLSDGIPSGFPGSRIDALEIREAIRSRNRHRRVVIHTIAIGERFPLLEWLAADSGGAYRTFP